MGFNRGNDYYDDNFSNRNFDNDVEVSPARSHGGNDNVETIYSPTRNVVRHHTNRRTVRRVHPTHIKNINRNITRVENFFPVTECTKNVNIREEYNCGSDLNCPRCRPVNNDCDHGHDHDHDHDHCHRPCRRPRRRRRGCGCHWF